LRVGEPEQLEQRRVHARRLRSPEIQGGELHRRMPRHKCLGLGGDRAGVGAVEARRTSALGTADAWAGDFGARDAACSAEETRCCKSRSRAARKSCSRLAAATAAAAPRLAMTS
jgi:hypothetical protein